MQYYNQKMGITKEEKFSNKQNLIAQYAKAISHPARVAILEYITQQTDCICGSIVNKTGLSQATISQHLKELKSLGLIRGRVEGNSVCYCIDKKNWDLMKNTVNTLLQKN